MTETKWLNEREAEAWMGLLAIMHRAAPEIERGLQAHDLLGVHYHILATLSFSDDGTMGLGELASTANLSQSRLTHRIRTLVERGEVEIAPDPNDGRAKRATLTAAGKARLAKVAPHHVNTVRRVIFDHLTEEQVDGLADALTPVAESLCAHPEYLNPKS